MNIPANCTAASLLSSSSLSITLLRTRREDVATASEFSSVSSVPEFLVNHYHLHRQNANCIIGRIPWRSLQVRLGPEVLWEKIFGDCYGVRFSTGQCTSDQTVRAYLQRSAGEIWLTRHSMELTRID